MIGEKTLDERFDEFVDDNKFSILRSLKNKFRKMSPAEKGDFIIQLFGGDDRKIHIDDVDLSGFKGDVAIGNWKVGGHLFQNNQEVGGSLHQDHQKVRWSLFQDNQSAGMQICQDRDTTSNTKDECECVEPNYKAEWEKMKKELYEADKKNETLLWALGKVKEASK